MEADWYLHDVNALPADSKQAQTTSEAMISIGSVLFMILCPSLSPYASPLRPLPAYHITPHNTALLDIENRESLLEPV